MQSFKLTLWMAFGLISTVSSAAFRFDASHSVGLDATFVAEIETDNDEMNWILSDISDQLFYTVGSLNHHQAVGDIAQMKVEILQNTPIPNTDFYKVRYRARLLVAWPKEKPAPPTWSTVLPLRVTEPAKEAFYQKYGTTCGMKDPDISADTFYYYLRPELNECKVLTEPDLSLVSKVQMSFAPSTQNTQGKAPEYHKVWEDGTLIATMIFGNDQPGATQNGDAGISAFNETYRTLITALGKPAKSNLTLPENEVPGNANPYVELEWNLSGGGTVNIALMLIQAKMLEQASPSFKQRYSERTLRSDFVSYNGHSGYGDNIRELSRIGKFLPGQYQIFFVFGCDTYAYVSEDLARAHQAVNPGAGPYKYLDMITNAYPGLFNHMAQSNLAMIEGLIGEELTYQQILAKMPQFQRSVVTGENDNRWPQPF